MARSKEAGLDRLVRNIRTGHFERSLSALTAAGALVTAAEIFFEHAARAAGLLAAGADGGRLRRSLLGLQLPPA